MKKISRREFVNKSVKGGAVSLAAASLAFKPESLFAESNPPIQFTQIALPYANNALEPYIDALTMEIHYGKHHAAYIKNVNDAIAAESISFSNEKDNNFKLFFTLNVRRLW